MLYKNAFVFDGSDFVRGGFTVEEGRFARVFEGESGEPGLDLEGACVIPGLVDVHNHGNSGADFSDGDLEGLKTMGKYLAANGVTSFAPASMTLPYEVLAAAFATAVEYREERPEKGARLMGIQMEGPFFSEKKKGAQNGEYLRDPDFEAFKKLYEGCGGLIRIADVAPELPGAAEFAEKASKLCTVSVAHTDADYEQAAAVFQQRGPAPDAPLQRHAPHPPPQARGHRRRLRAGVRGGGAHLRRASMCTPARCGHGLQALPGSASAWCPTPCAAAVCPTGSMSWAASRSSSRTTSQGWPTAP